MSLYACLYFDSDRSVSVLPKRRCKLRGPFQPRGEVEVDWRDEKGQKETLIATIIKVGGKALMDNNDDDDDDDYPADITDYCDDPPIVNVEKNTNDNQAPVSEMFDPYQRIRELEEENNKLQKQLADLKQQSSRIQHPAPSTEVLDYLSTFVNTYKSGTGADVLPVLASAAAKSFSISANLYPQENRNENLVQLLEGVNVYVDRSELRNDVANAHSKGPIHLLSRLLNLVYTTEELANSCGQGLSNMKGKQDGKKPLDHKRKTACKDYMTAFCIENKKDQPTVKQINEAITNQVSYARVKLRRSAK
ncbi:hypothetical protein QZH41_020104 [Actinostola sp. cb2023]|nr:hypothetical protein QZH41_020104 [Actinostola sp. cb2023]